ncbi:MAG: hypothetical protein JSS14_00855 [Proteobacteria bacterium]|nr:hypothetical protein [Pseudomonadota bacterium]
MHLAPGALIACEVQRAWGRPTVSRKASFQFFSGERPAAMEALRDWIQDASVPRSLVWIVGPTEAQYFVLPWSPSWVDPDSRYAYARAHYEQLYSADSRKVSFSFADPSADGGQLVSCISSALHAELADFAQQCGCELDSIKPSVAAVWKRFQDVLKTEDGTLCVVEGDHQALVRHDRNRIREVIVRRRSPQQTVDAAVKGVVRRFANTLDRSATPGGAVDLRLPAKQGFDTRGDATYAVALCGAL